MFSGLAGIAAGCSATGCSASVSESAGQSRMVPRRSEPSCSVAERTPERIPCPGAGEACIDLAREVRRAARATWPVRKLRLEGQPGPDPSASIIAEQRLAMTWRPASDAWSLAGCTGPDSPRHRMPVRVVRPDGGRCLHAGGTVLDPILASKASHPRERRVPPGLGRPPRNTPKAWVFRASSPLAITSRRLPRGCFAHRGASFPDDPAPTAGPLGPGATARRG